MKSIPFRRLMAVTVIVAGAGATAATAQPPKPTAVVRAVSGKSAGTVASVDISAKAADPADALAVARVDGKKKSAMPTEITLQREVFSYSGGGRRDPYKSLMSSSELRPLLSDLLLTAVAFDPDGNRSVAILRDLVSRQQYRIRVGQQIGRLRVAAIRQKAVLFTIEEFGFSRQETLPLNSDTTKVRNP